ncbi:DUF2256 domain-containing protein [Ferrimonas aestuarii]|uniref:DUF2256 domain-containing protein n=1 Tax=Ferrimonas aestuarii TaxID=2569539 RepID=A0A4U1BTU4_9GAMM|nr:DUF2256 domain-containing protein [Ferrimonas aestuarii]TKB58622.1 DUF2256 domain-containing protein [Ferrimonas aestuarii]
MKGFKESLPIKTCPVCQRPFQWRKRWQRVWDEVKYCSKRCQRERRRQSEIKQA